ncbi:hypothetical protein SAMN04488109_6671 [Chryseolinea serpens]|jgi:hypothetical protein|uniref:Uncharacterized protein n=1 Tax=Chryseolinea serpens TaxID=947013 RepID=A0A1M5XL85_9BACT|nr:hypothetical protein [Chryseolinea serpens]SHI00294.1 hypothetical protein SAMN04488109_6671 [Chryseolinea serpens]
MKIKLHYILFAISLSLVSLLGTNTAHAQDNTFPALDAGTYDAEAEKERDKVIYSSSSSEMEPQAIHKLQTPAVKDSLANRNNAHRTVKTAAESGKNANKPSSHSDDSVLSFNFLYYLFEKYKLQDIVD